MSHVHCKKKSGIVTQSGLKMDPTRNKRKTRCPHRRTTSFSPSDKRDSRALFVVFGEMVSRTHVPRQGRKEREKCTRSAMFRSYEMVLKVIHRLTFHLHYSCSGRAAEKQHVAACLLQLDCLGDSLYCFPLSSSSETHFACLPDPNWPFASSFHA